MAKVFFIADTHFGHSNIILYENRPFQDVKEMDEILIKNWNRTVKQEDKVFMLGDFSIHKKERTQEIGKRLNGRKTLIMGNHDNRSPEFYRDCGFECVSRYPIIYESFFMLSHEPLYINDNMPYGNIFGHVHSNQIYADYTSQSFCVSVERIRYQPIEFSEIKQKMGISIDM